MAQLDIFISHTSRDADIAEALINLLRSALNIPYDRIRCTSVSGYKLKAGASTDATLRSEVHDSKVFIGLITEASLNSAYVLFELGARWGASLFMAPLLCRQVNPDVLRGPLTGINALRADDSADLHQLLENIADHLEIRRPSPAAYLNLIEKLIEASGSNAPITKGQIIESEPTVLGKNADLILNSPSACCGVAE